MPSRYNCFIKTIKNVFVAIAALFICCSCSDTNRINKKGLLYAELVGDLYHQQYWDEYDAWDLSKMHLSLHYSDGEIYLIDAKNKYSEYVFEPASPVGLDHSITSIELVGGIYDDHNGNRCEIKGRHLSPIQIVDYPYGREKQSIVQNEQVSPWMYFALACDGVIVSLVLLYIFKFKRK